MQNNLGLVGFSPSGNFSNQVSQIANVVDTMTSLEELYNLYSKNATMSNRLIIHGKVFEDSLIESCSTFKNFYLEIAKQRGISVVILTNSEILSKTVNKIFIDSDSVVCRYFTQLTMIHINEIVNENIQVLVDKYKQVDLDEEPDTEEDEDLSLCEILEFSASQSSSNDRPDTIENTDIDNSEELDKWREIPDEFNFDMIDDEDDNEDVEDEVSDDTLQEEEVMDTTQVEDGQEETEEVDSDDNIETDGFIEEELDVIEEQPDSTDNQEGYSKLDTQEELESNEDEASDTQEGVEETHENTEEQNIEGFDDLEQFYNEPTLDNEISDLEDIPEEIESTTNEDELKDIDIQKSNADKSSNIKSVSQGFVGGIKNGVKKAKSKLENLDTSVFTNGTENDTKESVKKPPRIRPRKGKRTTHDINQVPRDRFGRKVILVTGHSGTGVSYVSSLLAMGYNMLNSENTLLVDLDFLYSTMAYNFEISTRQELYGDVVSAIAEDEGSSIIDDCIITLPHNLSVLTFNPSSMPSNYYISEYVYKALKRSIYNVIIFDVPMYILNKLPESFLFTVNPLFVLESNGAGTLKGLYNIENMEFDGASSFVSNIGFVQNKVDTDFNLTSFFDTIASNIDYESIPVLGKIPRLQWNYDGASFVKLRKNKQLTGLERLLSSI